MCHGAGGQGAVHECGFADNWPMAEAWPGDGDWAYSELGCASASGLARWSSIILKAHWLKIARLFEGPDEMRDA